jgi:hypothetical protein
MPGKENALVPEVIPVQTVKKSAKPRSEAQKAATSKALTALRAKRESQKAAQEAEVAEVKEEVKAAKKKPVKVPPPVSYATLGDLERFKKEMMSSMPVVEKPVVSADSGEPTLREKIIEKPLVIEKPLPNVVERIVEKVIEKPPRIVSGNELLDKIFFGR